ncbi:hypothetical protein AMJ40_05175 [candidate division TA06 bacterium DG_26]|uniref:Uncharacterized protein n=1 Tax=candidate division TA06 bacterium DG_26 TaxID=1703771 RepID=A0A0S7WHF4_UNCT6|nr:MAG: hypothetical protein AMJ40_05175 [candidate division TA06 bacterium DG_26]
MKKVVLFLCGALLLSGCEFFEPEEVKLQAPQNLHFAAIDDGLGVRLEWDAVADAEEYAVYFNSTEIARSGEPRFDHHSADLDRVGLGTYFVFAYKEDVRSPQSDPVSTRPKAVATLEVYDRDDVIRSDTTIQQRYDDTGAAYVDTSIVTEALMGAYGWGPIGSGAAFDVTDLGSVWQVYLDDGQAGATDYNNFHFVSANAALQGMVPPAPLFDTAYIAGPTDAAYAPLTMDVTAPVKVDSTYYLKLYGTYYVKLIPTDRISISSTFIDYTDMRQPPGGGPEVPLERTHEQKNVGIGFDYYYQKIENFRRF